MVLAQKEEMKKAKVSGMDMGFGSKDKKKGGAAQESDEAGEAADPVVLLDPVTLEAIQELGINKNVAEQGLKVFRRYDVNQSNIMEKGEFMRYLRESTGVAAAESDYDSTWRQVVNYSPKKSEDGLRGGSEAIFKAVTLDPQKNEAG